jgi:glycosyltransferase involved in cell wall biosynthesis
MKILHIPRRFVSTEWGGTETYVLETAKGLLERGHDAAIFTSSALSHEGNDEIQGVPVHRFSHFYPYLGLSSDARHQLDLRGGNLFSTSLLTRLLATNPPDLFHLHTGKRMGGIVRTAARYHHRPYVISLHGGVCDVPKEEQLRWTEPTQGALEWGQFLGALVGARAVLEDADAILCVNRKEQKLLQDKYPEKRVEWMPNSVPVAHYQGGDGVAFRLAHQIPGDARVILNIGRIDPQKNQMDTVEVFERVSSENPYTHLVLAGPETDPPYAQKLKFRILNSPYSNRIHSLGALKAGSRELIDAYHGSNVFLLTSLHEPFGIVLLEAWAAGLPVVAASVGGVPSFVEDCKNGMLYSSRDISEAVSCVKMLLNNSALWNTLRQEAFKSVQRFDVNRSMDSLIHLYEAVVREHTVCA